MFQAVAKMFHGIAIQFHVHSRVDLASREVDLVSREMDLASRKVEVAASAVPKPAADPHPLYGCRRFRDTFPNLDVAPVPVDVPVAVPGWERTFCHRVGRQIERYSKEKTPIKNYVETKDVGTEFRCSKLKAVTEI